MMKPVEDRSNADKQWIANFKFKFNTPQSSTRKYCHEPDYLRTNNGLYGQSCWNEDDGMSYISNPGKNSERRGGFHESNQQA